MQSLVRGCQFRQHSRLIAGRKRPQQAGTAKTLKRADPTIVLTPISPPVTNVPTKFINSSGLETMAAIIVAAITSASSLKPVIEFIKI